MLSLLVDHVGDVTEAPEDRLEAAPATVKAEAQKIITKACKGDSKQYLIEARLLPIGRLEKLKTINDLCLILRSATNKLLAREVLDAMTTNETLFYRDALPFEALCKTLLPALIAERSASKRLSFWSAASSSGQEAYSIAMILLDMGLKAGKSISWEPTSPNRC